MAITRFPETGAYPFNRIAEFNSSGNWDHPDGASANNPKFVRVVVIGGGGGGGNGNTGTGRFCMGSGGGGGHAVDGIVPVTGTVAITVGAGGNAASNNSLSHTGGYSAFGNLRAEGGNGGFQGGYTGSNNVYTNRYGGWGGSAGGGADRQATTTRGGSPGSNMVYGFISGFPSVTTADGGRVPFAPASPYAGPGGGAGRMLGGGSITGTGGNGADQNNTEEATSGNAMGAGGGGGESNNLGTVPTYRDGAAGHAGGVIIFY